MLQFLIIIVIGAVIGYYLGRSKYGDSIQDTYDRSKTTVSNTWQRTFGKSQTETEEVVESEGE